MYSQNKGLFFLFAYIIIANWLDIGTLSFNFEPFAWSGGIAWGPRYFIAILPFITLILGSIFIQLRKRRRLFLKVSVVSLCIISFIINLVGILVWYQYGIIYGWDKEHLAQFENNMDIMTWNPYYSPIILHMKSLEDNFVSHIQPERYINTSWYWTSYGLAPCSYDDYLYCKFGIASVLAISAAISIVAFLLLIEIGYYHNRLIHNNRLWGVLVNLRRHL
jgi:hypothetical protein